jgi:hypothetical protein
MAQSTLHRFDLQLCQYISGNMLGQSGGERYVSALRDELEQSLVDYLGIGEADDSDQYEHFLLDRDEINELELVADDMSGRFDLRWTPYESLHRRRLACVREIRTDLTIQDAEEWSRLSSEFSRRLEQARLTLAAGICIAGEWISEVRRYLVAMGKTDPLPYPDGRSPTPSNPSPPVPQSASGAGAQESANEDAVDKSLSGRTTKVAGLDLPTELSLREAAQVLGCDPKTVLRYIDDGMLQWRNAAPASSSRPIYKICSQSAIRLRTSYRQTGTRSDTPRRQKRRSSRSVPNKLRHITLDDS